MLIWSYVVAVKYHISSKEQHCISQTLRKKTLVARAVMVTQMPKLPVQISLMEASEKGHGHQMPKLTMKQQQEKLF